MSDLINAPDFVWPPSSNPGGFSAYMTAWAASLPHTTSPGVVPHGLVAGDWYYDNGAIYQVQP